MERALKEARSGGETMLLTSRVVRRVLVGMALRKKGMTDPKYLHPDYVKHTNR